MLRTIVLALAVVFLVGCGGGTMPFTSSAKSGSSSGTSSSGSGSGASSSGPSASANAIAAVVGPSQFSFSGYTWNGHGGSAPRVGNVNGNVGTFDPKHVSVGSELVLTLTQTKQGSRILSVGAEVQTKQTFTYGTFEFKSRVSNVASGSDASGFLYASNSITEIDMEQVGNKPTAVDCTNWKGLSNFQDTQVFGYNQASTHDFKIVWRPTHVDWYVDGKLVVSHTKAVPSAPAPFLFNLWGTNKSTWGGVASPGVTRYMHISSFKYTR